MQLWYSIMVTGLLYYIFMIFADNTVLALVFVLIMLCLLHCLPPFVLIMLYLLHCLPPHNLCILLVTFLSLT